ncbi:MAG: TIGR03089 family protein [Aeromicrobium sp.]|uniref:TIGR03089 family protein n=1 Tax=Aeromicrobium sp. TaxID=1871063 RepID=UPI0039E3E91A
MSDTLAGLAGRVAPSAPLITYYDLDTGERVELSGATTANWVAKTANFLTEEADVEPGTRVRVGLPTHWLRLVWLLSCWQAGAVVAAADAEVGVSGPELSGEEPFRAASALLPFGVRFPEPPEGFHDLGVEIPSQPDILLSLDEPEADDLAADLPDLRATHAELLAATTPDARRLVVGPGPLERDVSLVVAACLGGGSLVLACGGGPADLDKVTAQERAERG